MKTLLLALELILLTFLGITLCRAESTIDSHTVQQNNPNPVDKDGEIECTVEKTITDLGTQVKSFVSSTVFMQVNKEEASFTGLAQVRGTADTGLARYYENGYKGISDGKPEWVRLETLKKKNRTEFTMTLPEKTGNENLLYSGAKKQGVGWYRKDFVLNTLRPAARRNLGGYQLTNDAWYHFTAV